MRDPIVIGDATIYQGDCRAVLASLPEASVQCVVTSPPYWGLRDYGTEPVIFGGAPGCNHQWRAGGTITKGGPVGNGQMLQGGRAVVAAQDQVKTFETGDNCTLCGAWRGHLGLEPLHDCLGWATGDRCGRCFICHMVEVFDAVHRVLADDGVCWLNIGDCYATGAGAVRDNPGGGEQGRRWAGRDDAVGRGLPNRAVGPGTPPHSTADNTYYGPLTQPNRMPVPGLKPKDIAMMPARLALALQAAGWYVRQDIIWHKPNPMPESVTDRCTKAHEYVFLLSKSERYRYDADAIKEPVSGTANPRGGGINPKANGVGWGYADGDESKPRTKQNMSFAGSVTELVDERNRRSVWSVVTQPFKEAHFATFPPKLIEPCVLAGCPEGLTVLDPFHGAGTTGLVALEQGRKYIGVELNPTYIGMSVERLRPAASQSRLFA